MVLRAGGASGGFLRDLVGAFVGLEVKMTWGPAYLDVHDATFSRLVTSLAPVEFGTVFDLELRRVQIFGSVMDAVG